MKNIKSLKILFFVLSVCVFFFPFGCGNSEISGNPGDEGREFSVDQDGLNTDIYGGNSEAIANADLSTFRFVAIDAGYQHNLALKDDGTVWAWGKNNYGQLGINSLSNSSVPVQVLGLPKIKAISAGGGFSMALSEEGRVWTWGRNLSGQLGIGTKKDKIAPVQIQNYRDIRFVGISAGDFHALAFTEGGIVWGWGDNSKGQLGTNNQTSYSLLTKIENREIGGQVQLVFAGPRHSMALLDKGEVFGWGDNTTYQLSGIFGSGFFIYPRMIHNLASIQTLALGDMFSLGLNNNGEVFGWGDNVEGQLGKENQGKVVKSIQKINTESKIKAISAGGYFSMALDENKSVLTWGRNNFGQLGIGLVSSLNPLPTYVRSPENTALLSSVKAISAGYAHAMVLKEDGTIWTWGDNAFFQLGNGSKDSQSSFPVQIKTPQ